MTVTQAASETPLRQKFFTLLTEGRFSPDQIDVEVTEPGATLMRSPESESYIERRWQEHLAAGNKPWPNDLKPTRYRLASVAVTGGRLKIKLDPCVSYKDHIGSLTREFEDTFGHDFVPDALAVTVVVTTVDNQTLVTLRNMKTDYKPGGYHVSVGGFMDIRKETNPAAATLRETEEETGIKPEEIENLVCLGAAYNPWTLHTDLIFEAKTTLTAAELLERAHDDENELLFVPMEKSSFEYWMLEAMHANVVITMAAMVLVGQRLYGHEWRETMLRALAVGSRDYDSEEMRQELEKRDLVRLAEMVEQHRKEPAA